MKKTKILIMINSLGLGGAEKSLISLLDLLDYEKYEVDLQLINKGGMFENLLPREVNILPTLDYINFCKLSLIDQLKSFHINYFLTRLKTSHIIRKNNKAGHYLHDAQAYWRGCGDIFNIFPKEYDVAIAWGQGNPTHYIATKVKAKSKYAWVNANYELAGHNKDFDKKYYDEYDKIICVSNELKLIFQEVFPQYKNKLKVILDIKNPNLILNMSKERVQLPKLASVKLVTVGRYTKQKNYDLAIETAVELKNRGLDFVWYAVGEGTERIHLEEKIKESNLKEEFILLGAKSNPYPYINAADIYVQTSSFEGYCLALAEARMLNKPCVTTNFDVVYEQMIQRENGLVVEMTPKAVADGILEMLENEQLRNHIICYLENEKKGNIEEIKVFEELVDNKS